MMKVLFEVKENLESMGIELSVQNIEEACKTYNRLLRSGRRVVAARLLIC